MTGVLTFPIFPLSSVLLVPGAFVPLHVFEPRYREMVADALAGERLVAMAMPLPLRDGDDESRPRVHPVVGLGRIVNHRSHPDGRSDIVLAGISRMRIRREVESGRAYRTVEAEELPDDASGDVESAVGLLDRLPGVTSEERGRLRDLAPGRVLDAVLLRLDLPARERHRIHANPRVAERQAAIERAVARLAGIRFPPDVGPGDPRLN